MGYLFKGGLEDDIKSAGSAIDDAIIQPIVDNPAAVIGLGLNFMAPGLGTAIGTALGATGATAAVIGGAVIGGATSELTGGDFVKGAIGGGIGAGLGQLAQGAGSVAGNAADMTVQTAEQLGQGFESSMNAAGYLPSVSQGYYDELTGQFISDANGALSAPLTDASGTFPITESTFDNGQWMMPGNEAVPAPISGMPQTGADILQSAGAAPTIGPGYYNEITGEFIPDENGGLPGPLDNSSGTNPIVESNYANGQWTMPGNTPVDAPLSTKVQTGADIMKSAGALPGGTTSTTDDLLKKLLGAGATAKGVSSGLLGTGAPSGGEDQIFGKASQSKYSFDQQQPQYTPQSLMTISQLLGRR